MRALVASLLLFAHSLAAQAPSAAPTSRDAGPVPQSPSLSLQLTGGAAAPDNSGGALEILLLMTLLSLAPALVLTMTCFTRIVIVLSFLKRAI